MKQKWQKRVFFSLQLNFSFCNFIYMQKCLHFIRRSMLLCLSCVITLLSTHSLTHWTGGLSPWIPFSHWTFFKNCVPFLIGFCIDAGHDFFPENELGALIFGPHCHFIVLNCVFRRAGRETREKIVVCLRVCASVLRCIFISFENVFLIYAHPHGKKYMIWIFVFF